MNELLRAFVALDTARVCEALAVCAAAGDSAADISREITGPCPFSTCAGECIHPVSGLALAAVCGTWLDPDTPDVPLGDVFVPEAFVDAYGWMGWLMIHGALEAPGDNNKAAVDRTWDLFRLPILEYFRAADLRALMSVSVNVFDLFVGNRIPETYEEIAAAIESAAPAERPSAAEIEDVLCDCGYGEVFIPMLARFAEPTPRLLRTLVVVANMVPAYWPDEYISPQEQLDEPTEEGILRISASMVRDINTALEELGDDECSSRVRNWLFKTRDRAGRSGEYYHNGALEAGEECDGLPEAVRELVAGWRESGVVRSFVEMHALSAEAASYIYYLDCDVGQTAQNLASALLGIVAWCDAAGSPALRFCD